MVEFGEEPLAIEVDLPDLVWRDGLDNDHPTCKIQLEANH